MPKKKAYEEDLSSESDSEVEIEEELEAYKRLHGLVDEGEDEEKEKEIASSMKDGLKKSLDGFKMGPTSFVETLSVSVQRGEIVDAQDELSRELVLYKQAFAAMEEARSRLDDAGIDHKRPDNYFAEMVKDDKQMSRVKDGLEQKQHRAEESIKRQKLRELKRIAKDVQKTKVDEKQKQKKVEMEKLSRWRKDHKKGGGGGGDAFDLANLVGDDSGRLNLEDKPMTGGKGRGKGKRKAPDSQSHSHSRSKQSKPKQQHKGKKRRR